MSHDRFDTVSTVFAQRRLRRRSVIQHGADGVAAAERATAGLKAKGTCSCPAGTNPTLGGCCDVERDPNNCGNCGNVCPTSATCQKGKCSAPVGIAGTCAPGADLCTFTSTFGCNANSQCFCGTTTENATACVVNADSAGCGQCASSADCGAGEVCVLDTGEGCSCDTGIGFCEPFCPSAP